MEQKNCCIEGCHRASSIRNFSCLRGQWKVKEEYQHLLRENATLKICTCHYNEDLRTNPRDKKGSSSSSNSSKRSADRGNTTAGEQPPSVPSAASQTSSSNSSSSSSSSSHHHQQRQHHNNANNNNGNAVSSAVLSKLEAASQHPVQKKLSSQPYNSTFEPQYSSTSSTFPLPPSHMHHHEATAASSSSSSSNHYDASSPYHSHHQQYHHQQQPTSASSALSVQRPPLNQHVSGSRDPKYPKRDHTSNVGPVSSSSYSYESQAPFPHSSTVFEKPQSQQYSSSSSSYYAIATSTSSYESSSSPVAYPMKVPAAKPAVYDVHQKRQQKHFDEYTDTPPISNSFSISDMNARKGGISKHEHAESSFTSVSAENTQTTEVDDGEVTTTEKRGAKRKAEESEQSEQDLNEYYKRLRRSLESNFPEKIQRIKHLVKMSKRKNSAKNTEEENN